MSHDILDNRITLLWALKNMPYIRRHALESFLKSLWLVLLLDSNSCNVCNFTNEDQFDPTREFVVATKSQLVRLGKRAWKERGTYISP